MTFPLSLPGVFSGSALVFIPVLGMFAIPELLGGKDDWLVGNMIKESFLGTRDWPFGSMLSLMLTLAVLAIAGAAALYARRGARQCVDRGWLWAPSLAVYAFLYVPLAIVVLFSFNDSRLKAEWVGLHARLVPQARVATTRCSPRRAIRC